MARGANRALLGGWRTAIVAKMAFGEALCLVSVSKKRRVSGENNGLQLITVAAMLL